ncbi:MAG TPA: hypothetical protein ENI66_01725 [Candidatus Yonathbacteria bacterium]|nr:hypothetical protein [Candidatus Yonathbacteria bacterium]
MNKIIKNLKKYGAGILAIAVIAIGYYFFIAKGGSDVVVLDGGVDSVRSVEVAKIVVLLEDLRSININKDIFSNPTLIKLKDFKLDIPEEAQSRSNPFSPVF